MNSTQAHDPLPVGFHCYGSEIVEVIDCDPTDDYQPFLYLLADGVTVWIPVE